MTDGGSDDVLDVDGEGGDVLDVGEEDAVGVDERRPQSAETGSVTVVGTAHISHESVEEVERTIEERRPDVVAVELDQTRYRRLKGEAPEDIDPGDIISGRTVYQFLAYWMLSYVQARLGDRFDIEPGADMMAAIDSAEKHGSGVALVDRDIQVTVQRLWTRLRLREKLAIVAALLVELAGPWTAGLSVGFVIGFFVAVIATALGGPYLVPGGIEVGLPVLGGVVNTLVGFADTLAVAGLVALAVGVPLGLLLTRSTADLEEAEIDIERLTDADVVTAMIEEFRRFSPGGAEALIDERDAYIAYKLVALREAGYDVVAVVGAGHRAGIERYLAHPEELPPPETLVGEASASRLTSILYKGIGYAFTLGFLAFFILLAVAGVQGEFLLTVFVAWFLVNAVAAAALAKVAGAHWTSAGVGGSVAWLTSVNPLLAPGWFAGYVELRYTSVNVADISRLNEMLADDETPILELVRRMRDEVPTFRLILIVAMTNIGSFLASVFFAAVLLPYLAADIGGVGELGQQMLAGARESAQLIWETLT